LNGNEKVEQHMREKRATDPIFWYSQCFSSWFFQQICH